MKKTNLSRNLPSGKVSDLEEGLRLHHLGLLSEAKKIYEKILHNSPENFEVLHLAGTIAGQEGNIDVAAELLSKAVSINKSNPIVLNNYANILQLKGLPNEALELYNKAIALDKNYLEAFNNRAKLFQSAEKYEHALKDYDHILKNKTPDFDTFNNRGFVLYQLKKFDEAMLSFKNSLEIQPQQRFPHKSISLIYIAQNNYEKANEALEKAIEINEPDDLKIWSEFGNLCQHFGRFSEAINFYDRSIALDPSSSEVHFNKGVAQGELKNWKQALQSYENCLKIDPKAVQALNNKGNCFYSLGLFKEALETFYAVTEVDPQYVDGYINQGMVLSHLGHLDVAISCYQKAIQVNSKAITAYYNAADLFLQSKKFDEAFDCYQYAILLDEEFNFLIGNYLHTKMFKHDWSNINSWLEKLKIKIDTRKPVVSPFPILGLLDSASHQKVVSEVWGNLRAPINRVLPKIQKYPKQKKIRIGYYSADFHDHATMHLMSELFECHDKNRFEIYAFSYDTHANDSVRARVMPYFEKFYDVCGSTDQAVAEFSRELRIDIAIDLKGYTSGSRTKIFSYRAAPIQVNYLGYPGTMGVEYIDYLIADTVIIPESSKSYYSEKIAYMPDSYQVNDRKRVINEIKLSKKDVGLPEHGFVFCCFNSGYKVTPTTFDMWVRILQQVDKSVLWLLNDGGVSGATHIKKEAIARGLDPSRIIFADMLKHEYHLARYRMANLFLDTLPCNAHTTASDALWAGLPLITLVGETFAGRVAASLLNAVGLPELIAANPEGYEKLAIELGNNPIHYHSLRSKLQNSLLRSPLFDTPKYTKNLESLFEKMYERYQSNLSPDHIYA
jgi:predicted O-linked N-acetylglucosamine transferase (SPINDLY family)